MKPVVAPRASAILYNLLVSRPDRRPFLLPANICPIVPLTFFKAKVPFQFVDISPQTLHMDLSGAVERAKRREIGGVLYAHTYGEHSTPFSVFAELKQADPTMMVIDDRCLCVPDFNPDESTPADAVLYSTGYAKIVELGFGGYAFLKDEVAYQAASLPYSAIDLHALETGYKPIVERREPYLYHDSNWLEVEREGMQPWSVYRMQVAAQLQRSLDGRNKLNVIYISSLPPEIQLPAPYQRWRFNIRVPNKAVILERIFEAKLFASSHYPSLAGIMLAGRCPVAEQLGNEVINLFNDHHYTQAMAEQTCKIIAESL